MFDLFWNDFRRISCSHWGQISIRKGLGMNFGIILSVFCSHGGALERWWCAWCSKIVLRRSHFGSASFLKAPQSFPKGLPNRIKVVKRNNHQRIDKLYAFEDEFLVRLDTKIMMFFKQVSKIKLSIVSRCRRCKNIQKQQVFQWFWGFDALDVERKSYEKVMKN